MSAATSYVYLVESSYMEEDPHDVRLFNAQGLGNFLRSNLEHGHYANDSNLIHGIYRYESPGKLFKMELLFIKARTADDYRYNEYKVLDCIDPGHPSAVGFTVTIDLRV